jgi:hypothetical protein
LTNPACVKTIKRVVSSAAIENGHAIQVGLELSDNTHETQRCETHNAPTLVQALMQAAAVAKAQRKLQPGKSIEVGIPYRATGLMAAPAIDARTVAVRFLTQVGVRVVVAMPPDLAQIAIEFLTQALADLGRQSPRKN